MFLPPLYGANSVARDASTRIQPEASVKILKTEKIKTDGMAERLTQSALHFNNKQKEYPDPEENNHRFLCG